MHYILVFALFLYAASADDQLEECRKLFRPHMLHCCSDMNAQLIMDPGAASEDLKDCMEMPLKQLSCAREECIGKKKGFYLDGKINREALTAIAEKHWEKSPDTLALIKENCLSTDADISKYGMPDMCDLIKMTICSKIQQLKQCREWRDNCQETKDLIEKCSKVI